MSPEPNGDGNNEEVEVDGDGGGGKAVKRGISLKGEDISVEEKRDLNCAVKEYLVARGYKMSAMTFLDEVRKHLLWREGEGRRHL